MVSLGKIPHALLFTGPEELGKKTIALELISSIFKEKLLNHPDFILIEPEIKHQKTVQGQVRGNLAVSSQGTSGQNPPLKTSGESQLNSSGKSAQSKALRRRPVRGQIKINQIRNLSWKLSLKPVSAPLFAAIIDKAHLMTREAQNCFLKTLEEPKTKSLLILISEHSRYLLPTILSRCENIKFYPVKKEEITLYLKQKKVSPEDIKTIVDFSLGRPGKAIRFLENDEELEENKKKIRKLIKFSNSPLSLRFKYAKELSRRENLQETLNSWLFYFRKVLISAESKTNLLRIKDILNAIQETIYLISTTNVNPRLALEVLMMKI